MLGWRLTRIEGHSMAPQIPAGSFGLFRRRRDYRTGDIVLVDHPHYGRLVKQIAAIDTAEVWLQGTGTDTLSRAAMGALPLDCIYGRLIWLSRPPAARSAASS